MAPYDSTYGSTGTPSSRPASKKSHRSERSNHSSEATPLLARDNDPEEEGDYEAPHETQAESSLRRSLLDGTAARGAKSAIRKRWPSLVALLILCLVAILILVFAFVAPRAVEQYAREAATFEPSRLSIDSFTETGIRARIEGEFYMDPSKVGSKSSRDFGKFATYIAHKAKTSKTKVYVRLPEYSDAVFGSAELPAVKVSLRAGEKTKIDILSDIAPGSKDPIRRVAKDWLDGNINKLKVQATANVKISSGAIHLSGHDIVEELVFHSE
jgi:hypothetical protein